MAEWLALALLRCRVSTVVSLSEADDVQFLLHCLRTISHPALGLCAI